MRVFPERTRDFGAPFARLQSERIQRDALRVERDLHLRAQRGLCVRKFRRDALRAFVRGNRDGPAQLRLAQRAGKDIEIQRAGAQIETPLPLTVFVAKAAAAFDLCALNQTDAQIGKVCVCASSCASACRSINGRRCWCNGPGCALVMERGPAITRAFFSGLPCVASACSVFGIAAGSPPSLYDGDLLRPHRSPYCLRARSLCNLTEKCSRPASVLRA